MSVWEIIKAIPSMLRALKALLGLFAKMQLDVKKAQTKQAMEKVNEAKTTEEKQAALDAVAGKLGSN